MTLEITMLKFLNFHIDSVMDSIHESSFSFVESPQTSLTSNYTGLPLEEFVDEHPWKEIFMKPFRISIFISPWKVDGIDCVFFHTVELNHKTFPRMPLRRGSWLDTVEILQQLVEKMRIISCFCSFKYLYSFLDWENLNRANINDNRFSHAFCNAIAPKIQLFYEF